MEKLLIVDGSNLLFQMYYGMPARIVNASGRAIHGTLGFVGALLKIIRMTQPTHVAVVFDGEYVSERTALDGAYKGNRTDFSQLPLEDTPFSQLPDIFRALDYLGIRYQETTVCEADDWLAGYARRYGGDMHVVLASQDSDLFQLISEHVCVLRYRGKETTICDSGYLREKFGILPSQYAAFKSLTGDKADNIRGVDKVGPKTAAALLEQFGDINTLLARAEEITKPSIRDAVLRNRDRLWRNYALICLRGTEALPFSIEELRFYDNGATTNQVLLHTGVK